MISPKRLSLGAACLLGSAALPTIQAADDTVSTAVFSRVSKEYKRERLPDGSFKPEFYALGEGGVVAGTMRDKTAERVKFANIVRLTMPLLTQEGYHYAQEAQQADLLLVLHWGNTLPYNSINYQQSLAPVGQALSEIQRIKSAGGVGGDLDSANAALDQAITMEEMERMIRNQFVAPNARLLGYIEDINDNNDIRRLVGVTRYDDLMADVEESRYYVIISAYDFKELVQHGKQKLQWVTRVSVRTPGNSFDDSVTAMLKNASHYFGRESGKLIRGEELRGRVDLGEIKFLGTAPAPATPSPKKKK
jgi:hypothetical protein